MDLWDSTDVWKTIVVPGNNSDMEEQFQDMGSTFEVTDEVFDDFNAVKDVEVVVSCCKSCLKFECVTEVWLVVHRGSYSGKVMATVRARSSRSTPSVCIERSGLKTVCCGRSLPSVLASHAPYDSMSSDITFGSMVSSPSLEALLVR